MLTIIGVHRKSGTFQDKPYDNVYVHCTNDSPTVPTICGDACETFKVKAQQVKDVFNGLIKTDSDWRGLIGSRIRVYFDRFGNVEEIKFVDD